MTLNIRNQWDFKLSVLSFITCLMTSCSSFLGAKKDEGIDYQATSGFKPKLDNPKGNVEFQFTPAKGRREIVRTYSKNMTKTYSNGQILHEKEEFVDFTTKSEVVNVDATGNRVVVIETIRKEGPMDLYDLGFPELGESIEYVYTQKAEVKKASGFPNTSIFFIPPISLPKRGVEVGDTWAYHGEWTSLRNGLPMSVDLVTIFKNVFLCGTSHRCAELEISGDVNVPDAISKQAKVQSSIAGRLLYNLNSGSIIWSDIRNKERMQVGDDYMEVQTCTETILETPESDRWVWKTRAQCDPSKEPSPFVPGHVPQ